MQDPTPVRLFRHCEGSVRSSFKWSLISLWHHEISCSILRYVDFM